MYKFTEMPKTIFGKPKQFLVEDYKEIIKYCNLLILQDYDIKRMYVSALYQSEEFTKEQKSESKNLVIKMSYMEMIKNNVYGLRQEVFKMMNYLFDDFSESKFYDISDKDFENLKQLAIDVNCLPFEKKNPNDEIAKFDMMRNAMNNFTVSIESIYYSVWAFTGSCPDKMLMYDFYNLFKRLQLIKSYETSVIFKTIDSKGEIVIHPWFADEKKDVKLISLDELKNKTL